MPSPFSAARLRGDFLSLSRSSSLSLSSFCFMTFQNHRAGCSSNIANRRQPKFSAGFSMKPRIASTFKLKWQISILRLNLKQKRARRLGGAFWKPTLSRPEEECCWLMLSWFASLRLLPCLRWLTLISDHGPGHWHQPYRLLCPM